MSRSIYNFDTVCACCSTNQDPIFTNNKLPDGNEPGYPGGIFNPMGFGKSDMEVALTNIPSTAWHPFQIHVLNQREAVVTSLGH